MIRFNLPILMFAALFVSGCATPPSRTSSPPAVEPPACLFKYEEKASFVWPVGGKVISSFGQIKDDVKNKGIDIASEDSAPVKAAADGKVTFACDEFKGLGRLLVLDHGNGYSTVYAYNSELVVKQGDIVKQNDTIAKAGSSGRAKSAMLHFEIRRNGVPVDPVNMIVTSNQ